MRRSKYIRWFTRFLPLFLLLLIPDRGSGQTAPAAVVGFASEWVTIEATVDAPAFAGVILKWTTPNPTSNPTLALTVAVQIQRCTGTCDVSMDAGWDYLDSPFGGQYTQIAFSEGFADLSANIANTTYYYRARTITGAWAVVSLVQVFTPADPVSSSAWSTRAEATAPATAPGVPVPTSFEGARDGDDILLSWGHTDNDATFEIEHVVAPADTEPAAISRDWVNLTSPIAGAGGYPHVASFTEDSKYWYRIKAVKDSISSAWVTIGVTFPALTKSESATDFVGTSAEASIFLTWKYGTAGDGCSIANFGVTWELQGVQKEDQYPLESEWAPIRMESIGCSNGVLEFEHEGMFTTGARYWYRVRGIREGAYSVGDWDRIYVIFSPPVMIDPPTNFSAVPRTSTELQLKWEYPEAASGEKPFAFEVTYGTEKTQITGVRALRISSLSAATLYTFNLRARRNESSQDYSTPVTVSVTTPAVGAITAPSLVEAIALNETSIRITWSEPEQGTVGKYIVEGSQTGTDSWAELITTADATTQGYTHAGLSDDQTWYYRVQAEDTSGMKSAWSSQASATTTAGPAQNPPGAPTGLTAVGGPAGVRLNWVAPTDMGTGTFIGYEIEHSTDSGTGWNVLGRISTLTFLHEVTTNLSTRRYRVKVISTDGTGPVSDVVTPTVGETASGAPRDLAAVAAANGITLTWKAPTTSPDSPAITGYRVAHSADESTWTDVTPTLAATVVTYLHADAPLGETTYYQVFAINSAGESPAATVSATMDAGTPGAPTGLAAIAGETDITLTWVAPRVPGFSAITNYKVQSSLNAETWTLLATTDGPVLTYVHAAAPTGQTTYYRVIAVNTQGDSPASNTVNATIGVGTASSAPRSLTATAAANGITLAWLVPATPGNSPTTSYRIEQSLDAEATWKPLGTAVAPTYLHTGVAGGTTVHYRVFAINQAGNSPASNIANATMVGTTKKKPTAPRSLTATPGTTDIALAWMAPADTGSSAIENYRVERSANGTSGWSLLATVSGTVTSYDHTVEAGLKVYYRIFAINDAGDSPASSIANAMIGVRKPSAPRNLSAELVTDGIELTWQEPANPGTAAIENYRVERSSNGSSGWSALATVEGTTYLHTGAAASTTIYYRVIAISSAGDSPPSSTTSATTGRDLPTAPRSLTATVGSAGIELSWQAPADTGSSTITGYRIERSPNGSSGWSVLRTVSGRTTTYLHIGVSASTTVHYRVFAINDTGDSPASNITSATTGRDLPSAPRSLRVKAVRDGNQLTWREPADIGSSAITGFQIEESTDGSATWAALTTPDADATGYLHRNPEPGTTTYYRVFAINESGEGPASNVVSMETAANPPTRPRGLSAYATGTVVRLAWNPPDDDGGATVTGYRVEAARNMGGWGVLVADTESRETSYTDRAEPGSTVSYRVSAINAAGRGPTSNVVRVEVEAVAPEAPGGVGALATSPTAIGIAWNPPTNDGGSPVTAYRIEHSNDGGFWNVLISNFQSTSTSYRHTNLKPATEYHYRVFAINKIGIGESSPVVTATTHADLPGIVERLTATAVSATHIDLSWIEPKYTGGVDIDAYEIETSLDGSAWRMLASTNGDESTYQHRGLEPATPYHYRVTARNEVGRGKTSRAVFTETKAALPAAPTDLTAKALSHEEIYLTWGRPSNSGGARITGYFIEYSSDEGSSWLTLRRNTGSTNTVFTHSGLTRATAYSYRVAAINKVGAGEKSDVANAKTFAVVSSPPRYLEAEVESSTQIDLSWTEPEDNGGAEIISYLIETSPDLEEWSRLADVERGLEYSHTDVTPGQTYHYRASAKNEAGYSLTSNVVSAATDDPLERTERVISAILPRFAITAVNSAVRAIATRIDLVASGRTMNNRINVRGGEQGFQGIANGSQAERSVGGASIWGSADLTGLTEQGTVDWDGQVFSVHAGVDGMLRDGILVGLAGSRSRGTFDFTDQMGVRDVEGEFDANLTSMNPYVAWVRGDAGMWATTGFGWGEIEISNDGVDDRSSTLISSMVAVGGYREILSSPMGAFRIKAEGISSSIEVAGNVPPHIGDGVDSDHINESTVNLRRGRVMLDWTAPRKRYGNISAELRFEGGMRYDYNDLETGINGAELGGGLQIDGPIFRAQGNGRIFLHPDHREWGIQGLVELRSRQENGLSLQVSPTYGNAQSGLNQLWENGAAKSITASTNSGQVSTVLEYRRTGWSPYSRMDYRGERATVQTGVTYRLNGLDLKGAAAYREDKPGLSLQIRLVH